jgi:hypothetical protein
VIAEHGLPPPLVFLSHQPPQDPQGLPIPPTAYWFDATRKKFATLTLDYAPEGNGEIWTLRVSSAEAKDKTEGMMQIVPQHLPILWPQIAVFLQ